jgi:hypothetical protein
MIRLICLPVFVAVALACGAIGNSSKAAEKVMKVRSVRVHEFCKIEANQSEPCVQIDPNDSFAVHAAGEVDAAIAGVEARIAALKQTQEH